MTIPSFGKYAVTRLIGRGGMAEVYEGVHPDLARRVAIKVILPQLVETPGFEERFRREARMVASLRHPHIVRLFDFDLIDGRAFMVMEYLEGDTLEAKLAAARQRGALLPLTDVAGVLDAIASALDHAHARHIVHRDIKPSNILFTADGQPVLSDFGVARLQDGALRLTSSGGIVGSPAYMAPEQATGQTVDARSDVYALGVVLYEAVMGQPPFAGATPTEVLFKHVQQPPPTGLNPNLPPAVEGVILQALAKQPDQRFPAAGALAQAFAAALRGQAPAPPLPAGSDDPTLVGAATPPPTFPPPPSSPAPQQAGWLTRLLDAANIVAPLVGKSEQTELPSRSDGRARLAALFGAIAIFVALINFISDLAGLVNIGRLPVGRIWPFLVGGLLLAGAGFSIRALRHAPTPRRRVQAAGLLAAILIVSLAWGGWTAFRRLQPPARVLITVNQFDGSASDRRLDIAREIADSLRLALRDVGDLAAVELTAEALADETQARRFGQDRKSTLLIWGWYDSERFRTFIELLQLPNLTQQSLAVQLSSTAGQALRAGQAAPAPRLAAVSTYTQMPAQMQSLDFDLAHASQQMTYVAEAVLGLSFYANAEYEQALARFDKALTAADAQSSAFLGLEKVYFHRGMALLALGRKAEAVADLEKAAAEQPDLYEARRNLAIAYAQVCLPGLQLDKAVAAAEAAAQMRPKDASAQALLGEIYYRRGRFAAAAAALQKAVDLAPTDASAWQWLGEARAAQGESTAAAQAYDQALTLIPAPGADAAASAPDAALQRGDVLTAAGRYQEALAAYTLARDGDAARAEPWRGLGNTHYWLGDLTQALAAYETAAQLAPAEADIWLLLGLAQAEAGQPDAAIAALQQAAALADCDPAPHLVLGGLYWQQDDLEQAAQAYETALAIDPSHADAQFVLGSIRWQQGAYAQAVPALQEAIALRPDFGEAYRVLGQSYRGLGDWAAAAAAYERLAELAPADEGAFTFLGDAYTALGRADDAIAAYEQSLALVDDAVVRVLLGVLRLQAGDLAAAQAEFQQALVVQPGYVRAHQALGNIYQQQGAYAAAIAEYEQALAASTSSVEAQEQRAFIYVQLATSLARSGREEEAIAALQAALDLAPADTMALGLLAQVYAGQGELALAQQAYEAVVAVDDQDDAAFFGLSLVAYKQCSLSTAVQAQAQAVGLAKISGYQAWLAYLYAAQGRDAEAEALFAALAAAPAEDVFAHGAVGDHLFLNGKLDAAAQAYQKLFDQAALTPLAAFIGHNGLGKVLLEQGKLLPAASEFEQALAAFPAAGADPQMLLGDIALREGDVAAALAAYDRAAALLPDYQGLYAVDEATLLAVGLHVRRSIALTRAGDEAAAQAAQAQAQALALAQEVVNRVPRSPLGHLALGLAHQVDGADDLADRSFAIAAQCDQNLAAARAVLAAYLAALGSIQ